MAPTKRTRPAFEPPRPRKTPSASTSKSTTKASGGSKSQGQTKTSKKGTATKASSSGKRSSEVNSAGRRRSRLVSPTPSASDSLGDEEEEDGTMDVDSEEDDEDEGDNTNLSNRTTEDSPEPDYILAEVSHEPISNQESPIPLELIHRILHSKFADPGKTKISTDAREIVGKYIEVFVREAIMRCSFEKGENGNSEGGGGWLEVEDLEKVVPQLCLDF